MIPMKTVLDLQNRFNIWNSIQTEQQDVGPEVIGTLLAEQGRDFLASIRLASEASDAYPKLAHSQPPEHARQVVQQQEARKSDEKSTFEVSGIQRVLESYSHVVVTGGLGFVGQHLVAALANLGKSVTVVDVALPKPNMALPPGVRFRQADLREPSQVMDAVKDAELVFHLAGNASGTVSVDRPRFDFETNALGTFNLAEALVTANVRRTVYLSSAMVYGRPRSVPISEEHPTQPFLPYGASKLTGELIFNAFYQSLGLPVVSGRAFVIYGSGEDPRRAGGEVSQFLRWHLNRLPISAVGDIDRKSRDFIHISDLVAGLLIIADRAPDGEVFNLGSGQEVSLRQLAQTIGAATGWEPTLAEDASITEDTYRHVADISKLRSLGFQPRTTLLDGIRELARLLGDKPELPSVNTIFRQTQRIQQEV